MNAPGQAFSVTVGVLRREPVFRDIDFGEACVAHLRELRNATSCRIYAFCLMPDHVHLLLAVPDGGSLPALVGSWKSRCAGTWRRRTGRPSFWQRGFFDHAIRADEDLQTAAQYILTNPVRAGIAAVVRDYRLTGSFEFEI